MTDLFERPGFFRMHEVLQTLSAKRLNQFFELAIDLVNTDCPQTGLNPQNALQPVKWPCGLVIWGPKRSTPWGGGGGSCRMLI